MKILSSAKPMRQPGAWLLGLLLLAFSWLVPTVAHATHLRAGDIQAKVDTTAARNPNRIFFKLTLYRDPSQARQPDAVLYFGDGTNSGRVPQTSEVTITNNSNANLNTSVLTFYFDHTYPGSGSYNVAFVEANRVNNVVNMIGSVNQTFYINTTITIDPGLGLNRLPVLKAPAIDLATAGQVFLHNPAAYDADGDSLAFRLTESRQVVAFPSTPPAGYTPVPAITTGFQYPNSPNINVNGQPPLTVPYNTTPAGLPAIFEINARTGQLVWNAPARLGVYNVAIVVEEWRRNGLTRLKIGEVVRDMQINVVSTTNLRPIITIPQDTCVVAGSLILKNITAVDGSSATSPATAVQLFAYGGMLPPATFTQSTQGPPRAIASFRWTPTCANVAKDPYLVVFKAQDTPRAPDPPLIDEKTWRITVIGPAPTNLQGAPNGSGAILLSWNTYGCQTTNVANQLPILRIYRREGCFAYTPGPCETGIPAGSGYQLIASVPGNVTAYNDDNNGQGLPRGRTYSYRIYAEFPLPAGGSSIVSNETCITLGGRSSQITNVDVLSTSPTGQISVKWTQPRPSTGTVFNAPLGYRLSRSATGAAPFTLVTTKTSLTDTTYVDNVNTQASQYTYQLVFFSAATTQPGSPETAETAPLASSVRLSLVPNGLTNTNALTWAYQVPWDNTKQPTRIFRRTGTTGAYAQIATVTSGAASGTYSDQDPTLVRGQTYCYYVQTNGQYAAPVNSANQLIYTNLLNKSQEQCAALIPTPCTPVLTVSSTDCDTLSRVELGSGVPLQDIRYQNRLRWTVGNTPTGCSTDIAYFRLFYRTTADGPLALLDSVAGTQFTYLHRNLVNRSGCYAVQAVSPSGVRSAVSNIACLDNCLFFTLPNIFTPNGDRDNEKFRPKTSSPITRTHIQIFNRWGRKVYESDKDPYINWDGSGSTSGETTAGKASDGVYYYVAEVEFADFAKTKRTFKGWVEIVR